MKNISREKKAKEKKDSIFTPETLGVVIILFASLALICLITFDKVFSNVGLAIAQFLLGAFGFFAYPFFAFAIFYGFLLISGKKTGFTRKQKFVVALTVFSVVTLVHLITARDFSGVTYGEYISLSYNRGGEEGFKCTGGGALCGLVAGFIVKVLQQVGAYVVISALTLFSGYLFYLEFFSGKAPVRRSEGFKGSFAEENQQPAPTPEITAEPVAAVQVQKEQQTVKTTQKLFVADPNSFAFKTKRDVRNEGQEKINLSYTQDGLMVAGNAKTYSGVYDKDMQSKLNYIKTPAKIDLEKTLNTTANYSATSYATPYKQTAEVSPSTVSAPIQERAVAADPVKEESVIPLYEYDETVGVNDAAMRAENFRMKYAETLDVVEDVKAEEPEEEIIPIVEETRDYSEYDSEPVSDIDQPAEEYDNEEPTSTVFESPIIREIFAEKTEEVEEIQSEEEEEPFVPQRRSRSLNSGRGFGFSDINGAEKEIEEPVETEPLAEQKPVKEIPPIGREYFRPSWDLLESYTPPADLPKENHEERLEIIKQTLEEFGISVEPQGYVQGPSITRYEIKMPAGISVKRVLNFDDDLQMRLAARNGVRIEAPIPGKNLVGIEVANSSSVMVGLKEVLMGMAGQTFKPESLIFALGKDIVGSSKYDDLSKGPHYLIAGSSGSGKSVCLNVMIVSLIMRYSPEELRFILIDPKRVEMRKYEHIPHLMVDEIITDPKKTLAVLQWAIDEMERRYAMFEQAGSFIDGIAAYNQNIASDTVPKMPKIVIVIDEFGDLMANVKKDLEVKIQILTQKARAAGIHIVLATQRPSANVVTGVIKTNLPSRIAFKVGNYTDSMIILDGKGAEKLLGNGDMLYKNSTMPDNERYQGAFISSREVNNIVSYIIEKNKAYFDDDLKEYLDKVDKPKQEESVSSEEGEGGMVNDANTDLLIRALSLAINSGTISISQVQRRFQIGYIRAAGIIDKMEGLGYISGNEGSKTRKVYITREEFEAKYGPMSD